MKVIKTMPKYKIGQTVYQVKEVVLEDQVSAEYHISECVVSKVSQIFCRGYYNSYSKYRDVSRFNYLYSIIPVGCNIPVKDICEEDLSIESNVSSIAKEMYKKRIGEQETKIASNEETIKEAQDRIERAKQNLKKFKKLLLTA